MQILTEGKAKFYASRDEHGKISKELEVFYNPVMKFNRDLCVWVLKNSEMKDIQIADIMAGSGVRSLRFLLELNEGVVGSISVNDNSENFIELFNKNLELNIDFNNSNLTEKMIVTNDDANSMLLNSKGFDYIDIDPFGGPNDFLDLAVKRISRGGILAVSGTDTAPLSGTYADTCKRNYWATPMRNNLMHEIGIRIFIRKVQLVAAQYDRALIPVYSYFRDHYNRIFFKCIKRKTDADEILSQHKYLLYCKKCMNHNVSEYNYHKCVDCGHQMDYSGPMWTGNLFDSKLADAIVQEYDSDDGKVDPEFKHSDRSTSDKRFVSVIAEESKLNFVGFYDIHAICKYYKKDIPPFERVIEDIKSKGYLVSRTHINPYALKTNMPIKELLLLI